MSYLRQPSPLSFEPLSPSPSENVGSSSESERDSDSRKAKRRRVEDLGRQYLTGRPLFIQTASLRGPFDKGWVNPWKKPRRRNPRHSSTDRDERRVGEFLTDQVVQAVAGDQLEDASFVARGQPRSSQQVSRYLDKPGTTARGLDLAARPKGIAQEQLILKEQEQRGSRKEEQAALPQQTRASGTVEPTGGLTEPFKKPHHNQTPRSLICAANEWLKSDDGYLAEQPREELRSSTPTPTSRPDDRATPRQYTNPRTPMPSTSREALPPAIRHAGFTPINVPSRSPKPLYDPDAQKQKNATTRSTSNAPLTAKESRSSSPKVCQRKATTAGAVRKAGGQRTDSHLPGFTLNVPSEAAAITEVSRPSEAIRDPVLSALATKSSPVPARGQDSSSAKRPAVTTGVPKSPTSYPPLTTATSGVVPVQRSDSGPPHSASGKALVDEHEPSDLPSNSRNKVQTVAPSTNMSAFKYRQVKSIPGHRSGSAEASVEPSAFVNRQIQKPRRLDFASSEGSPHKIAAQASTAQAVSDGGAVHDASVSRHGGNITDSPCEEPSVELKNPDKQVIAQQTDEPSHVSSVFQEAQAVPNLAGKDPQAPSASSTNLMETDKQSLYFSTETDDASAHLSTQAAIAKAQLSFKADLNSPIKQCLIPSPEKKDCNGSNYNYMSHVKTPKHNIAPFQTFRTPSPEALYKQTPATSWADEQMSTQQMIDAVTPFAFSTTKKPKTKKRISFTTSINRKSLVESDLINGDHGDFGRSSLDMDTSPEASDQGHGESRMHPRGHVLEKVVSSANSLALPVSFSIAPNGTLREVFQQDGQVEDADMDLGAVLDDVGSFLQSWDIEAELKKSTGPSTTGSTNPGSRVHTGISSGMRKGSRPQHHS